VSEARDNEDIATLAARMNAETIEALQQEKRRLRTALAKVTRARTPHEAQKIAQAALEQ
jgi:hypothetical protein